MEPPRKGRTPPKVSKSQMSAGTITTAMPETSSIPSSFFPFRLTATLSALKIVCGCALIALGAVAMVQKAGYARQAAGIWGGVVVIISGVLGAYAVRTTATRLYVFSFLFSCLLSLLASVLVVIYSATGLTKDASHPGGYYQKEDGSLVPEESRPSREIAMLVNTLLIIIGVLDVIFSIPSIIICLRELCQCYNPALLIPARTAPSYLEGVARKEWLMSWLGQQSHVFYSQASGIPYGKLATPQSPYRPVMSRTTPPFVHIPSEQSQSVPGSRHSPRDAPQPRQRGRSKSPNPRQTHSTLHPSNKPPSSMMPSQAHSAMMPSQPMMSPQAHSTMMSQQAHSAMMSPQPHMMSPPAHSAMMSPQGHILSPHFASYPPMEVYTPFYPTYGPPPPHPSPNSNLSHPHLLGVHHPMPMASHPPWIYAQEWDEQMVSRERRSKRRRERNMQRDQRKRSRSKSQGKEVIKKKRPKGLTDSDIERTYTGMDRELAEEFIEQTMDPAVMVDQTLSGTESEAW